MFNLKNIVKIIDTPHGEMLEIIVNNKSVFFGNYWDFSWYSSLPKILSEMGAEVLKETNELDYDEDEE